MSKAKERVVHTRTTPLSSLKRKGKVLASPASGLNMQFSSWINDAIPEVLWSLLAITGLPREDALGSFRRILAKVRENKDALDTRRLEHSRLAELEQSVFNSLFADECAKQDFSIALSPLLLLEALPDRKYWEALLPKPDVERSWSRLAETVARTFDHQSQEATDARWLKITTVAALGKLHLPTSMAERAREFDEYPNRGDMRSVRPSIRALEMSFRPGVANEKRTPWMDEFWQEGWQSTECVLVNPDDEATRANHAALFDQLATLYEALIEHFLETIDQTGIDAKHDACFGLTFYVLQLLFFCLKSTVGQALPGRIALRSAVECYIVLAYLAHNDNPTVWLQFRNYGAGQSKLAFLKRLDQDEVPSFISSELLEQLANQDAWMEFQDIKLGAWADKNLRNMAQEAGEKAFYDRYYDALSGYVHGNWSAVSHAVFGLCLNPLHRFHRVPLPPRLLIDDAVPDLMKIGNLALDKLAHMYPAFKPRLREAHSKTSAEKAAK
ncbi:DUF5677 domain-containing protein [Bradyrhizobium sp. A5]|uniref:DUF5677 domain-containing protein n=1 Tax=Bradyrhizobium sp. A5 TaxID=3133696 RepID=UPI00324AFEF3